MGLTRIRAEQISDIDYKQAVRVISTSDVNLTGGAPSQVDGVSLNVKDRILVTGQNTASQNGLYDVTVVGSGSNGTWVRTSDSNATGEINAGMIVMVTEGNTYADTSWKLITDDPIVIGITALTFLQNTGNSFSIIDIVGSANVVANAVSSTVSFASGNNFSITGNAAADTITFNVVQNPSFTGNVYGGNLLTAGLISATGNAIVGNLSATGNIAGNYFIGNGAFLTGISGGNSGGSGSNISNGTSNITVVGANDNITVGVSGVGNVVVFAPTGEYVTGLISATGNVTGNYILGNGSQLTNTSISVSNWYTGNVISNSISNIEFLRFNANSGISVSDLGNNSALVTLGSSFKTWEVAGQANLVAVGEDVVQFVAGNNIVITTNANVIPQQISFAVNSNLTGISVSVTGNVTGGNLLTGGLISATGNIYGTNFIGNLSNGNSKISVANNGNVTVGIGPFDTTYVTIAPALLSVTGNIIASGNITVVGNISANNSIITGFESVTGNVYGGNILTAGLISATSTITSAANISGGNILTAGLISATSTITSAANISGGNILTAGLISATSTITSAANISGGNILTAGQLSAVGNAIAGNLATAGIVTATGNVIAGNILTGGLASITGNITTAGNINTANIYGATGVTIATGGNNNINLYPGGTGNIVLPSGNATYINNLPLTPVQDNDAASKYYVDILASSGLAYHTPVYVATTTTLATTTGGTITYAQPNGAGNGIGATITTTGSFNLIDTGNVQTVGTRILVKDEANAVLNGIYTWSNATAIVRSTDADEYGPDSANALSLNDYFFTTNGNVNIGTAFIVNAPPGVITFGTSNITFATFSTSQTYTSGNGISIAGTVINARVDNVTTAFDLGGNISVKAGANLTTPNIGAATGTSLSATGALQAGTTISAAGNVTGGNILTGGLVSATGNVTGNYILGNGALLTGVTTSSNTIFNANSNVAIATANANVTVSVSTVGNVVVITPTGLSVTGTITSTGNATAGNILTAGLMSSTGNAIHGNILTAGLITATGNITGGNILTTGLMSSTGNAIHGNILTAGLVSATGNATAGNILTTGLISATSTIISAANISGGNISTAGLITATGNVTGGNILTAGLISATGNATSGNISTAGLITATGNVTGGNLLTGGNITATGNVTALGFVSTGGTGVISGTGNVIAGNILTGGVVSATGNVTGNYFIGNGSQLTGVAASSVNANALVGTTLSSNVLISSLTAVGTLSILSVAGNTTSGNLLTPGLLSATGNLTGNYILGNGAFLTGVSTSYNTIYNGNSNVTIDSANANITLAVSTVGNVAVFTTTGLSVTGTVTSNGNITGGNITTAGLLSATGNVIGGNITTAGLISATGNAQAGNILTAGLISATSTITSAANISGGNILTTGLISATGNIISPDFIGNLSNGNSKISVATDGNVTVGLGANNTTYLTVSPGLLSVTGNIKASGFVSAVGNVIGNYFVGNGSQLTGIIASAGAAITNGNSNVTVNENGNVTVGVTGVSNVLVISPDVVSATGNLAGNYILGNGALLTGVTTSSSTIFNGNSNVAIATANANITVSVSTVGNVAVFTPTGLSVTGNVYGNLFVSSGSGGGISAPGNIVGGNLITAGNVTGNYFIGDGSQLTGIVSTAANLSNGLSNVTIASANANVTVSVSGTGNIAVFTPSSINITGNITATGNIVAGGVRSTSSASAPTNPTTGDFWYDTSTNTQYRFTFDGTNYYWIDDFGATAATQPLFTGPVLFNDVSTQTNGQKGVFALKNNQANVAGVANSKQLQVVLNGAVQTPFVKTWVWPFWCVDVSFKGFKVTTLGYSATANSVVLYRPPAKGTQVSITQVNTATDSQLLRYPYSATTIAISD